MVLGALEIANAGLHVFPVRQDEKRPTIRGWREAAATDGNAVRELWDREPNANVGILCGRGLVVIDADSDRGLAGLREFGLPETPVAKTPRGRHFYFRGSSKNAVGVLPDVDVRGTGGFVIGPPSRYGEELYEWLIPPWELPLADVPSELQTVVSAGRRPVACQDLPPSIPEGERNVTLFRIGCSLRGRHGLVLGEITQALSAINEQRCRPPLPGNELEGIARSASSYDRAPKWATNPIEYARDFGLSGGERFLLIVLARHANHKAECWRGIRRLREDTGFASNTITKHVRRLKAAGCIEVTQRGRGHQYRLLEHPNGGHCPDEGKNDW